MHATEEDLQAIAQIEESEAGGQEDDDDDDLPQPQAPLSPCSCSSNSPAFSWKKENSS